MLHENKITLSIKRIVYAELTKYTGSEDTQFYHESQKPHTTIP